MLKTAKANDVKIVAPIKKAIFTALGERDQDAAMCWNNNGLPEPDSELRNTERIPLAARYSAASALGFRTEEAQRSVN